MSGIALAIAGACVAIGVGVGMWKSGESAKEGMIMSAHITAMSNIEQEQLRQCTERARIAEEGRQANMWCKFDRDQAKEDKIESRRFQAAMDRAFSINSDERNIRRSSESQESNQQGYSDHHYPSPRSAVNGGSSGASANRMS